jgi:23S rRNA (adenine1618-N6)-methyltransferase
MRKTKKEFPKFKSILHPRNRHRERYDFEQLVRSSPSLKPFVSLNKFGDESIDFANSDAVKALNTALLRHFYEIKFWEIPENYLCPPIPGRADYIHHIADRLASKNDGKIPKTIKCLDIGVGANCVYPIIGNKEHGWIFVGSDIDPVSIASANRIIQNNPGLNGAVECRLQTNPKQIFRGIIKQGERFDLTVCNPPFHSSLAEATAGNIRKLSNLGNKRITKPTKNFGGQNREVWCEGGELQFVRNMITESSEFRNSVLWFSTLVSKQSNLKSIYSELKRANVFEVKTIQMGQGNKISRIVAWTYQDENPQKEWQGKW